MQSIDPNQVKQSIDLLNRLTADSALIADLSPEDRIALLKAAGLFSRPNKDDILKRRKATSKVNRKMIRKAEREARSSTGIREARKSAVFQAPKQIQSPTHTQQELKSPRNCYVCKAEFTKLHFFYDSMCESCGEYNYKKRFQTASLHGQVALITGARLKIGYHAALMMLRAGAKVIVSTRFPIDAALRYSQEEDFHLWQDRLQIHGLDLRHTPSVEIFCRYIEKTNHRLDILINNAAQTVRRPPGFYSHLMENESKDISSLPSGAQKILTSHNSCLKELNSVCRDNLPVLAWQGLGPAVGLRASAKLSQIPYSYDNSIKSEEIFPRGELDADLQQVDLRTTNSWRLKLADVPAPEMLEVQLVNAVAPFILCSQLAPLMRKDFTGQKHIVNVTAMEGKFYRFNKADRHPHTNMAKAALNMLTHTSASDLAKDGIYMNAVDTGWVTDEDPITLAKHKQEVHDFQPPLDIVDGAARVCDPFFDGILTGKHWCGKFLKDYFPIDW